MASLKSSSALQASSRLELRTSLTEAKAKLEDRIEKGREIQQTKVLSTKATCDDAYDVFKRWDSYNEQLLRWLFTADDLATEYRESMPTIVQDSNAANAVYMFPIKVEKMIQRIDSIIERLDIIPVSDSALSNGATYSRNQQQAKSNKVFVVHGHDEVAKTSLEIFLHENGLNPVVLHRQADEGQTLIEKFEKHSDVVGYVFILLTPDEVSYLASDEAKADADRTKERRARPNVIFEFGYFIGKLGRARVCCLHTGNVALPSDLNGIVYKKYVTSIEEVGYSILKDLRAAGILT